MQTENLLKEADVCQMLGLKDQTLRAWRSKRAPNLPYVKLGRSVRYRKEDVLLFIEQSRSVA